MCELGYHWGSELQGLLRCQRPCNPCAQGQAQGWRVARGAARGGSAWIVLLAVSVNVVVTPVGQGGPEIGD